jgi:hypothetical protein
VVQSISESMGKLNYSLNDHQLLMLGKIHSCFGTIEQFLQILILMAYRLDVNKGQALVGRMDTAQKIDIIKEAVPPLLQSSVLTGDLEKLCSRVRSLASQRNRLTHAAWCKSATSGDAMAVALKHWGRVDKMIYAHQLEVIVSEAEALQDDLAALLLKINVEGYWV